MGTIHIAGFPVQIGPKYRQRCAWCDAILIDGDLSCEMVPEGQEHRQSKYELGALVDVTKDGPCTMSAIVPHEDGAELPANACVGPPKLRVVRNPWDELADCDPSTVAAVMGAPIPK